MKKKVLLVISLFAFVVSVHAQQQKGVPEITMDEAKDHIGEKVTICAEVQDIYYNQKANGSPTLLNFGAPYPKQVFSALIWKDDLPNFDYTPADYLKGKQICLTGFLKLYKGKPEMILNTQYQIYE